MYIIAEYLPVLSTLSTILISVNSYEVNIKCCLPPAAAAAADAAAAAVAVAVVVAVTAQHSGNPNFQKCSTELRFYTSMFGVLRLST